MKRILIDVIIVAIVVALFMLHAYEVLPAPLQLAALKMLLVSFGVLHAHIVRKILFPRVDWDTEKLKGNTYVSIVFYIVIPVCYAFGG